MAVVSGRSSSHALRRWRKSKNVLTFLNGSLYSQCLLDELVGDEDVKGVTTFMVAVMMQYQLNVLFPPFMLTHLM